MTELFDMGKGITDFISDTVDAFASPFLQAQENRLNYQLGLEKIKASERIAIKQLEVEQSRIALENRKLALIENNPDLFRMLGYNDWHNQN